MERLLSAEECGRILGLSTETVREYCKRGVLKAINFNARWKIREQDLSDFVGRHVTTEAPPWMRRAVEHLLKARPVEPHYEPVVEGR